MGGVKVSDFRGLSWVLAMLEIKKPIRKIIDGMFLKFTISQAALLGILSGLLVPITACIPIVFFLLVGILYSIVGEIIVPGITGFQNAPFFDIILRNIKFFGNVILSILTNMAIPSAFLGLSEIVVRHLVFKNPHKRSIWKWIYEHSAISILASFTVMFILLWQYQEVLFGIVGVLFITAMPAYIVGLVYRSILLVSMDNVLKVIYRLRGNSEIGGKIKR